MRLRWRKRALRNFFAIHRFISNRNPGAGHRIGVEIQNAALRLKQFPRLGHPGEKVGVFELQVPGRPYLITYRIADEVVEILSVFDQWRDPEDLI